MSPDTARSTAPARSDIEDTLWKKSYAQVQAGDWHKAEAGLRRLCAINPQAPLYGLNLARVLVETNRSKEALDIISPIWESDRSDPTTFSVAINAAKQHKDSRLISFIYSTYQGFIPDPYTHLLNEAQAQYDIKNYTAAAPLLIRCAELNSIDSDLHYKIGDCLYMLDRDTEALISYTTSEMVGNEDQQLIALQRRCAQALYASNWNNLAEDITLLKKLINSSFKYNKKTIENINQFSSLWYGFDVQTVRLMAEKSASLYTSNYSTPRIHPKPRYRIGYLSDDFANHAVNQLLINLLELQSQSPHEYIAYSYTEDDGSDYHQRFKTSGIKIVDVVGWSSKKIAEKIKKDRVDILIDLKGYTGNIKMSVLATKPAPVIINFLGYPSTSGAPFIDYVLGDGITTPESSDYQHTEKIAQLPHCYMPTDSHRAIPAISSKEKHGLPSGSFVFCCFNQSYKINPQVADTWAEILQKIPKSVLWLSVRSKPAERNLAREFEARGLGQDRIYFAPKVGSLEEHLSRYSCADLFLDTWPFGGHTTACEALWSNLPVLTAPGENFTSRVGASLVANAGLADFACVTIDEYIEKAVYLAQNPELLTQAKKHLHDQKMATPLFDIKTYAKNFDLLMTKIIEQQLKHGKPDHIIASKHSDWHKHQGA